MRGCSRLKCACPLSSSATKGRRTSVCCSRAFTCHGPRTSRRPISKSPLTSMPSDSLDLNGYNLMKFPLIERKAVLRKLLEMQQGWIRFADHVEETGTGFFNVVAEHGLEGMVAKLKTSEYQQARSRYWLKIKTQHTDHFVVGGFTPPEGSRKYFGSLLVGLYNNGDLIYVGRSGGGFDDRDPGRNHEGIEATRDKDLSIQGSSRRSAADPPGFSPSWSAKSASASGHPTRSCARRSFRAFAMISTRSSAGCRIACRNAGSFKPCD